MVVHLLLSLFILFSFSLFSYNPPSTIHLDMSSKKVPTKRNQLEVNFKAYTEGEMILGNFVPYTPGAEIIQINFPESFYFSIEPFEGSFIVSYGRDGLYQIYGTIEDFQLKNI
ncbi:MAG: hypothetical protein WHV67_09445, partial [Thermoanaerobaculia bacterium]